MSVSAADILLYAKTVLSTSVCESGYRNSVSRSYYAAMHHCRDFQAGTSSAGGPGKKRRLSHARLINSLLSPVMLDAHAREKSISLGLDLQVMKTLRNVADYDLGRGVTRLDAEDAIERAKIIFEEA